MTNQVNNLKNDFKQCPMCGSQKIENHGNRKWVCPDCGFDLYCNVAAAVGIIIQDKNHNVLFEVRAKEPQKGFITLPGGFVDFDESAEEAAVRECREEIGFAVEKIDYLCSAPNTYVYKNIEYKTCDMYYIAELPPQFATIQDFIKSLTAEESEVLAFEVHKIETLDDVEKLPVAFESGKHSLRMLVQKNMEKLNG